MKPILVLGLGLVFLPAVALSQPEPGSRVRVDSKAVKEKVSGTFEAIREGRVILRDPRWSSEAHATTPDTRLRVDPPATFPVDEIKKLEVWRGQERNVRKATLIGAGLGLAVMGILCAGDGGCGDDELTGAGVIVLGGMGAAGGALVGLAIKADRWEEVPFTHLRVGLAPPRAGAAGLAVRLSF